MEAVGKNAAIAKPGGKQSTDQSICRPRLAVPGHSTQIMPPSSPLLLFILSSIIISYFSKVWLDSVDIITLPNNMIEKLLSASGEPSGIRSFSIDVSNEKLQQTMSMLEAGMTQLPENAPDFWRNLSKIMVNYDWKQHERFLNTFKQYKTKVDGIDIHFLRVSISPPADAQIVPIVLLHGFPGAYWDFYKIIPILSNPRRFNFDFGARQSLLFDVIVPSLPGFMFSSISEDPNFSPMDSARLLIGLMKNIGISEYYIHGNELLGTEIATIMAAVDKNAKGIHLSNHFVPVTFNVKAALKYFYLFEGSLFWDFFRHAQSRYIEKSEFAANTIQDSPLSQCGVIMHFWEIASIRKNPLNKQFTYDELATICYLYWLTDSLPSALRIMKNWERNRNRFQVTIPSAILQTADTPWKTDRSILNQQFLNLTRVTAVEKGGLFHSLEISEQLAADIFRFVELTLL